MQTNQTATEVVRCGSVMRRLVLQAALVPFDALKCDIGHRDLSAFPGIIPVFSQPCPLSSSYPARPSDLVDMGMPTAAFEDPIVLPAMFVCTTVRLHGNRPL